MFFRHQYNSPTTTVVLFVLTQYSIDGRMLQLQKNAQRHASSFQLRSHTCFVNALTQTNTHIIIYLMSRKHTTYCMSIVSI